MLLSVMFTPNPHASPCKLIHFSEFDTRTKTWGNTREVTVPWPVEQTRILNCFIDESGLVVLVVDEAIMFLDKDLKYLSHISADNLDPSFIYISCMASDLSSTGGKGFLLSG